MNKEYTVQEFTEAYLRNADDAAKKSFLNNNLKTESYIGYNRKLALADRIVQSSSYRTETAADEDGAETLRQTADIKIDSNMRYFLSVYTIVQTYTNIDMNIQNMPEEFDELNRLGLIKAILEAVPENELEEFRTILRRTYEDFIANSYENHAFISNQVQRISNALGSVLKPFLDRAASMDEKDFEKLGKGMEKIFKSVK